MKSGKVEGTNMMARVINAGLENTTKEDVRMSKGYSSKAGVMIGLFILILRTIEAKSKRDSRHQGNV